MARFAEERQVYRNEQNYAHKVTVTIRVENGDTPDDVLMAEMRLLFRCAASGVGALYGIENGGDQDGHQTDT